MWGMGSGSVRPLGKSASELQKRFEPSPELHKLTGINERCPQTRSHHSTCGGYAALCLQQFSSFTSDTDRPNFWRALWDLRDNTLEGLHERMHCIFSFFISANLPPYQPTSAFIRPSAQNLEPSQPLASPYHQFCLLLPNSKCHSTNPVVPR